MRRLRRLGWWALFALVPLTIALMVLDDEAPFSETWRLILLGGIVVVICMLAIAWTERNARLVERDGVDALISYRPLPGTIEAMGAEPSAQESFKAGQRRLVVDFDPMACPPVANNRPNDALDESSS